MVQLLILLFVVLLVAFLAVLGVVTMTFSKGVSGLVSATEKVVVTDAIAVQANPSVPVAQPAVLTTHTTNTTGTLTMTNSSHGIVTGQRLDISWVGGQCYGAVAGTVSGLTVPIASVSGGSNLPASLTAVVVGIPVSSPFNVIGNNISGLVMSTPKTGYFVFADGSSDLYAAFVTGGNLHSWKSGDVGSNPLAGSTPTHVNMSHFDTAGANANMQAAAVAH